MELPSTPTKGELEVLERYLKEKKRERTKNNYGKQNYYEDRQDITKGLCIFRHSQYKSKPYYMRYYVKDKKYKTLSLKTTDKTTAIQIALEKWKQLSNHIDSGGTPFEKKTSEVIDLYLKHLQKLVDTGQLKMKTLQSKRTSIVKLRELLEDYPKPSQIPINFLKDYVIWRRTKNWNKSFHKNNPKPPSDLTVNKELQDFQGWVNWCIEENIIGSYLMKEIKFPFLKVDERKNIEKNPAFTYDDWIKLTRYMNIWITNTLTLKGNQKKNNFYRKVTRLLILILGNTGMRLHEGLSLTWRDVQIIEKKGIGKKSGEKFTRYGVRIQISPFTKTGRREVIAQGGQYFKQLRELYQEEIKNNLNRELDVDDLIFQNVGTITSHKDDFVGKKLSDSFFRRLWYELRDEMEHHRTKTYPDGIIFQNRYTMHSMRSWFINEKLASGVAPSVVGQIVGHSTKVMDRYYKNIEVRSLTDELIKVRFRNLKDSDFEIYDFDNGEVLA